jgi:hypothetical protein
MTKTKDQRIERASLDEIGLETVVQTLADQGCAGHSESLVRRMLTKMVSDPDGLILLKRGPRLISVAATLDTVGNATGAAVLEWLFLESSETSSRVVELTLHAAMAFGRRVGRRRVEIELYPRIQHLSEEFRRLGLTKSYTMVKMCRDQEGALPEFDPPVGCVWTTLSEPIMELYYKTLQECFVGIPGFHLPQELEAFETSQLAMSIPVELLMEADRIAGFASAVFVPPDRGIVALIGRHPDWKGRSLGPCLLRRSMAMSAARGATVFSLSVAVNNERALRLYREHGFRLECEHPVYGIDL